MEEQNGIIKSVQDGILITPLDVRNKYSDGYHTFDELYNFRKLYNALLFNGWAKLGKYDVHKSRRYYASSTSEEIVENSGWFVVMASLPTGQISQHYHDKDWSFFNVPEKEIIGKPDGHTSQDVLQRLTALCADADVFEPIRVEIGKTYLTRNGLKAQVTGQAVRQFTFKVAHEICGEWGYIVDAVDSSGRVSIFDESPFDLVKLLN